MDYKDLRSIQESYNAMYSEEVVEEGLAGMIDKASKAAQGGLEKMGVKINRTPKPTARPSVRTQDTMRQNQSSMEEVDAFDIVKGHLIDEGATEEEALKAMLTMTEEDINAVVEAYVVTNADKKGNTPAYQNYLKGMKNKKTGEPLYKAAPHLKESEPLLQVSIRESSDSLFLYNRSIRNRPMTVRHEIKSQLAKLLATEDLIVEHRQVETAQFNVQTRVLTLPQWEKASNFVYDMLVGHEVGHALFTPDQDPPKGIPHTYLNIVEDARIEKLMKRKYLGLGKTFYRGYKELSDEDFFVLENEDISKMGLPDRINLHFKIGNYIEIPISSGKEQELVDMVAGCETFEDVIAVAEALYKHCKEEKEKEKVADIQQQPQQDQEDSGEGLRNRCLRLRIKSLMILVTENKGESRHPETRC